MDVHERLKKLMKDRGWSEYRLSKKCGLSESTLANIFRRNTVHSVSTLEAICEGFGITMSQFFSDGRYVELSDELSELCDGWLALSPEQKRAILMLINTFKSE